MIATTLAFLVLQNPTLPQNPDLQYSGLPWFDAGPDALRVNSHSATLEIGNDTTSVTTVTEVRNLTARTLAVKVRIPRYRVGDGGTGPSFAVTATINNHPLKLDMALGDGPPAMVGKSVLIRSALGGTLYLAPTTTYGLRTSYQTPVGRAGFDRKMRFIGYLLGGTYPIGQLNVVYRTASGTVFRLPRPMPALAWQVGGRGAFLKLKDFTPANQMTYVTYYPAGFDDIGG